MDLFVHAETATAGSAVDHLGKDRGVDGSTALDELIQVLHRQLPQVVNRVGNGGEGRDHVLACQGMVAAGDTEVLGDLEACVLCGDHQPVGQAVVITEDGIGLFLRILCKEGEGCCVLFRGLVTVVEIQGLIKGKAVSLHGVSDNPEPKVGNALLIFASQIADPLRTVHADKVLGEDGEHGVIVHGHIRKGGIGIIDLDHGNTAVFQGFAHAAPKDRRRIGAGGVDDAGKAGVDGKAEDAFLRFRKVS